MPAHIVLVVDHRFTLEEGILQTQSSHSVSVALAVLSAVCVPILVSMRTYTMLLSIHPLSVVHVPIRILPSQDNDMELSKSDGGPLHDDYL